MSVLNPIKEAFRDIFPKKTGQDLYDLTLRFENFMERLKIGPETAEGLRRTFAGFFAVLSIGKQIITGIVGVFGDLLGALSGGNGGFLSLTGTVGDWLVSIDKALKKAVEGGKEKVAIVAHGMGGFVAHDGAPAWGWGIGALLVLGGLLTALPLIGFADAVRRIPYSLVGVLQYIAPTLQLLAGVLVLGEPFGIDRAIGFGFIWFALLVYAWDGLFRSRSRSAPPAAA